MPGPEVIWISPDKGENLIMFVHQIVKNKQFSSGCILNTLSV